MILYVSTIPFLLDIRTRIKDRMKYVLSRVNRYYERELPIVDSDGCIVCCDGFIMFTVHAVLALRDDLGRNRVFADKIMLVEAVTCSSKFYKHLRFIQIIGF